MPSADHDPSSRFALAIVVAGLVALASSADAGDAPSGVAAPPEAAPPGGDVVADDCGAFALRLMIGEHAPGRRGAGAIGLAPDGSRERRPRSVQELVDALRVEGIDAEAVRVDAAHVTELTFPFIAYYGSKTEAPGHFAVVWDVRDDAVRLVEQEHGAVWITRPSFAKAFSGIAIVSRRSSPAGPLAWLLWGSAAGLLLFAGATPLVRRRAAHAGRAALAVSCLACLLPGCDGRQPGRGTLHLDGPTMVDYGTVAWDGPARRDAEFTVVNGTDGPSRLAKVVTSCGCLSVTLDPTTIPAGATARAKMEVRLKEGEPTDATAALHFEGVAQPLTLRAVGHKQASREFSWVPALPVLVIPLWQPDAPAEVDTELRIGERTPARMGNRRCVVLEATSNVPGLEITTRAPEAILELRTTRIPVHLRLSRVPPQTVVDPQITLKYEYEGREQYAHCRLQLRPDSGLRAEPARVDLRAGGSADLVIGGQTGMDLHDLRVAQQPEWCRVVEVASGRPDHRTFRIEATDSRAAGFGSLSVASASAPWKRLAVPVRVEVR